MKQSHRRGVSVLALALSAFGCSADGGEQVVTDAYEQVAPQADAAESAGAAFPAAAPESAGRYATRTQRDVGPNQAFTLVAPSELATSTRKHPIITWGNGTGAAPSAYTSLLNRLASHGFVVIASNSPNTGSANEMLQGVDWVLAENETPGSALYQKLDPGSIGATGHSQGGFGTCAATRDPRIKTIAPIQGFRAPSASYRGSTLAIAGEQDEVVKPSGIRSGFARAGGPAVYAELKGATHVNWISGRGVGAELNEAVVAWMRVHLMDDQALRGRFYGPSCAYCSDAGWTVEQKNMPGATPAQP